MELINSEKPDTIVHFAEQSSAPFSMKNSKNKRFTIGEWVYSHYVDGFKRGNIYYRPVYDKGYNFSRRYIPNQNINSFRAPIQQPFGYFTPKPQEQEFLNKPETSIENFGDLPILE